MASRIGQRDAMEAHQRLAHLEPMLLLARVERRVGEDALAHVVVVGVEDLDGVEVTVDDHVEQTVQEVAHAVFREVR
jgi:hypothetical protein